MRLYAHTVIRDADHLNDINDLRNKSPNHDYILYILGLIYYHEYEDYKKSITYFLESAEYSNNDREKLIRLIYASEAYSKLGNYSDALFTLEEAKKYKKTVHKFEDDLLKSMIEIFENKKDDEYFLSLSEAYLELCPNEHDVRFSTAFKYYDIGESDLSLYHYKKLSKHRPNETVFNNLGVAYSNLGLPAKSVKAYRNSSDQGGTLAMSNLAHKLINEGFLNEAETICNEATQIKDFDKNIGGAISQIKGVQEEEKLKEKVILEKIEPKRDFYSNFGKACLEEQINDLKGSWIGPEFNLVFKIKNNSIEAYGTFKGKKKSDFTIPVLYSGPPEKEPEQVDYIVKYQGNIVGKSIKFKKWIYEKGKQTTTKNEPQAEGMMILSNDLILIDVYEKGTREKENFYKLELLF